MGTKSNNGGYGDIFDKDPETVRTSKGILKVCKCGNTFNEAIERCPQCFLITEEALPLLLD